MCIRDRRMAAALSAYALAARCPVLSYALLLPAAKDKGKEPMVLHTPIGICGYAATHSRDVPVLTSAMLLPGGSEAVHACAGCPIVLAYGAMRCAVLRERMVLCDVRYRDSRSHVSYEDRESEEVSPYASAVQCGTEIAYAAIALRAGRC
eukprot:3640880-Rhodomonas_salina.1